MTYAEEINFIAETAQRIERNELGYSPFHKTMYFWTDMHIDLDWVMKNMTCIWTIPCN